MGLETAEEINAKKSSLGRDDALRMVRQARHLYVAKGKKVVYLDLAKDKPDDNALAALVLGRSGTLRAPTLRRGQTLIVGFNKETYQELFG